MNKNFLDIITQYGTSKMVQRVMEKRELSVKDIYDLAMASRCSYQYLIEEYLDKEYDFYHKQSISHLVKTQNLTKLKELIINNVFVTYDNCLFIKNGCTLRDPMDLNDHVYQELIRFLISNNEFKLVQMLTADNLCISNFEGFSKDQIKRYLVSDKPCFYSHLNSLYPLLSQEIKDLIEPSIMEVYMKGLDCVYGYIKRHKKPLYWLDPVLKVLKEPTPTCYYQFNDIYKYFSKDNKALVESKIDNICAQTTFIIK